MTDWWTVPYPLDPLTVIGLSRRRRGRRPNRDP